MPTQNTALECNCWF